jgi:hypothetical protein
MNGDMRADNAIHLMTVNKWLRKMDPSKNSHAVAEIET